MGFDSTKLLAEICNQRTSRPVKSTFRASPDSHFFSHLIFATGFNLKFIVLAGCTQLSAVASVAHPTKGTEQWWRAARSYTQVLANAVAF
jgi:hypothetical protein